MIGPADVVRWILTVALAYGVYTETGIWTAMAIVLITVNIEALALLRKQDARRRQQ